MGSIYDMKMYGEHTSDAFSMVDTTVAPHSLAAPPRIHEGDDAFYILERTLELLAGTRAVEGFLTHYDFLAGLEESTRLPPGPTGLQPLPDMLVRLSRGPVVSIASTRGHATGVGSELALACDMRFCESRKSHLVAVEVGAGLVPGQRGHRGDHGLGWLYRPAAEHEQVSDHRDPATADGMMMMVCLAWPKLRIDNNG